MCGSHIKTSQKTFVVIHMYSMTNYLNLCIQVWEKKVGIEAQP